MAFALEAGVLVVAGAGLSSLSFVSVASASRCSSTVWPLRAVSLSTALR
jgi:hypothetical protein